LTEVSSGGVSTAGSAVAAQREGGNGRATSTRLMWIFRSKARRRRCAV
jgi:hypothetical protein